MFARYFLIILFFLPAISYGQDNEKAKDLAVEYNGDPAELKHKLVFSVQDNSQFLFLVLEQNYGKTQKLSLQLNKFWRGAVRSHCNGKYKGRPKLAIAPIFAECMDPETGHRTKCVDIISGVSGKFTCAVGS